MYTFTLMDIFEKSEESANLEFTKIKLQGFIYDYKLGIWYKYDLQKGEQKENSSWCSAVGVDLAKLLF